MDDFQGVSTLMHVESLEGFDDPVDMEEQHQIIKDSLLPAGWYATVPSLMMTETTIEGRRLVRFSGTVINRKTGEEGRASFRLSSQRSNKPGSDKPDMATKLYSWASQAYQAQIGEKPTKSGQIYNYVMNYPILLNMFPGTDNVVVSKIAPLKEEI